jgi:hypothetical protein
MFGTDERAVAVMKICARCVLPETFPGITFDADGVCSECQRAVPSERLEQQQARFRAKFESVVEKVRGTAQYDCLMSYSGGKDSTYTLKLLVQEYGLRVLAVVGDNGFIAPRAFENIRAAVKALDIDLYVVKPRFGVLKRLFTACIDDSPYPVRALERASSICNSCMGVIKLINTKLAVEKQIPLAAYGWSPGQAPTASSVFKMSPAMILQTQSAFVEAVRPIIGDDLRPYLLDEAMLEAADVLPTNVSPLAFFEYDEDNIHKEIATLGWRPPLDTDANSSNCLLNSFANLIHMRQFKFHPYAMELSGLVRRGLLEREEGIERTSGTEEVDDTLAIVEQRLGMGIGDE